MAERAPESPIPGDHKDLFEDAVNDVEQPHAQADADAGPASAGEDYPIERVEAVYRKLDLRIIPGSP